MKTVDFSDSQFRISSFSSASGTCVEVAMKDGAIAVRSSKSPRGGVLVFSGAEWEAFIKGVKAGEFDLH